MLALAATRRSIGIHSTEFDSLVNKDTFILSRSRNLHDFKKLLHRFNDAFSLFFVMSDYDNSRNANLLMCVSYLCVHAGQSYLERRTLREK